MNVDEILGLIRKSQNITQEQLARDLDVRYTTLNRWENGHFEPSRLARKRIIEFCMANDIPKDIYAELEKIR
jgi:transcriptional regulator with XRE-family HTH domain